MMARVTLQIAGIASVLLLAGCAVGPNYNRPAAIMTPAYKEPPPETFKEAQAAGLQTANPSDAFAKGKWWEIYNDAALNALEEQISINNQNVLVAEANYRQGKAAVRVTRGPVSHGFSRAEHHAIAYRRGRRRNCRVALHLQPAS